MNASGNYRTNSSGGNNFQGTLQEQTIVPDHTGRHDNALLWQGSEAIEVFESPWANATPSSMATDPHMARPAIEPLPPGWEDWYTPSANGTWMNMITPRPCLPRPSTARPRGPENTGIIQTDDGTDVMYLSQNMDENADDRVSTQAGSASMISAPATSSFSGLQTEIGSRDSRVAIPQLASIPNEISWNGTSSSNAIAAFEQVHSAPFFAPRATLVQPEMVPLQRTISRARRGGSVDFGIGVGYHEASVASGTISSAVPLGGSSSNAAAGLQRVHPAGRQYRQLRPRPVSSTGAPPPKTNVTASNNATVTSRTRVPEHILAPRLAVVAEAIQKSIRENTQPRFESSSNAVTPSFPKRRRRPRAVNYKRNRQTRDFVVNGEVLYTKERYGSKGINAALNAEIEELDKIFFDNSRSQEERDAASIRHTEIKVLKRRAIELAKRQKNAGSNCNNVQDPSKRKHEEDEDEDGQGGKQGDLRAQKRVMI
jgi:hypothetical protein